MIAGIDLGARERAEAVHAELFAAEAAHDGAVDHGTAQFGEVHRAGFGIDTAPGQVADEAAGEAVARAGGIEDILQQVTRGHEVAAVTEEDGTVLAALDDQGTRPHAMDGRRGPAQVVLAGEHTGFGIVDEQEIPLGDGCQQLVAVVLDPVVHGVAAGEPQSAHLAAHAALTAKVSSSARRNS